MEIRFLQEEELANAAGLSRFVFDTCLRPKMEFPQTISFVEAYLSEENLRTKVSEEGLLLWGVYESGQLLGVSGMQSDGLITMLYILPQCAGRKYGTKLLETMRLYAKDVLGLSKVTVNANPAFTSYYFKKKGFEAVAPRQNTPVPFVSMYATSESLFFVRKKRVPAWVYIVAAVGCVLFATLLGCGFMAWYLF
jgi:N-acetylglutamate synthase-like GNAT family acetyltransferase